MTDAESLKKKVKAFIDSEENTAGIELKKAEGTTFLLVIAGDMEFTLKYEASKFLVETKDSALKDEWLKEVAKYTAKSKNVTDILVKCADTFATLGDEEEAEDDIVMDDEEEDSAFQPITKQKDNKLNDMGFNANDLEKVREQFKTDKHSNQAAIQRLSKDYIQICKSDTKKYGFTAEPVGDDLFTWHVKMFGFNKKDKDEYDLANDLEKYKAKSGNDFVLFEMKFPAEYPFKPPFIRCISPRFAMRTGHITIGGSICFELLTMSGWSPGNSIEAIIIQIRTNLILGKGRIDFGNMNPYTEHEAREAYLRVAKDHNWAV